MMQKPHPRGEFLRTLLLLFGSSFLSLSTSGRVTRLHRVNFHVGGLFLKRQDIDTVFHTSDHDLQQVASKAVDEFLRDEFFQGCDVSSAIDIHKNSSFFVEGGFASQEKRERSTLRGQQLNQSPGSSTELVLSGETVFFCGEDNTLAPRPDDVQDSISRGKSAIEEKILELLHYEQLPDMNESSSGKRALEEERKEFYEDLRIDECLDHFTIKSIFHVGDFICSPDKKFFFGLGYDGGLGIFHGSHKVWSGQMGATMQPPLDGELIINELILQAEGTDILNTAVATVKLANDGYLAVTNEDIEELVASPGADLKNDCPSHLSGKQLFQPGDQVCSPNGRYSFGLALDGDLALLSGPKKVWSGNTCCRDDGVIGRLQADGNFVVRNGEKHVLWASGTNNGSNLVSADLILDNDGVVTIQNEAAGKSWILEPYMVDQKPVPDFLRHAPLSEAPSLSPSRMPSLWPSSIPTMMPSSLPTTPPSISPSVLPSSSPTTAPTPPPTPHPTPLPSSIPTMMPSLWPTTPPSVSPSVLPSSSPTNAPTPPPTPHPTPHPTRSPTLPPTQRPTSRPTPPPTTSPTNQPTMVLIPQNSVCLELVRGRFTMATGEFVCSPKKRFRFGLTVDGDLAILDGVKKVWSAGICCAGDALVARLQLNGNLVVSNSSTVLWTSGTAGHSEGLPSLVIGEDGIATITCPVSGHIWSSAAENGGIVDASSLDRKAMAGYQGWFFTEGDGGLNQWQHWSKPRSVPDETTVTIDMWPDLREFETDELYPTNFTYKDGSQASVYSAYNTKTVERHCRWMQEYGVDGVFVQRFIAPAMRRTSTVDTVLGNIRSGSEKYGRVFAVMYDIGKNNDGTLAEDIIKDWKHLVDDQNITQSSRYLRHRGRPLLAIWGFGFHDRAAEPHEAAALIDWLRNKAEERYRVTLMGGTPAGWRDLRRDSKSAESWASVYRSYDVISPWTVGRMNDEISADKFLRDYMEPDVEECNALGIDYLPVVFPGFSSSNLYPTRKPFNEIPRMGGTFFWHQMHNAVGAGNNMIYVAMFDEVDEGTAIFKIAENSSLTPKEGRFLTLDEDEGYPHVPNDWYLRLTGAAANLVHDGKKLPEAMPTLL